MMRSRAALPIWTIPHKERVAELKAIRDQARADAQRASQTAEGFGVR